MAKNKKRARGASPQSASSAEAGPVASAQPVVPAAIVSGAGTPDRFDPFRSPRARLLANAFIAVFLAYQLVMPLRYYMGGRGLDERFSWRMFSSVRMLDCDVSVGEHVGVGGDTHRRAVNLGKTVQIAWIGLLERGRALVISKLLSRRCDEDQVVQVDYHLSCKGPDGAPWPDVDHSMKCSDRKLLAGRGEP